MRAIDELADLLKTLPQIDELYKYSIPQGHLNTTDKTQCLLREVQVTTDNDGNNTFNSYSTELEIQLFFKLNIDFNTEDFQVSLLKALENNHYEVYTFGGMVQDPDTKQLTSTIYVQNLKYINK